MCLTRNWTSPTLGSLSFTPALRAHWVGRLRTTWSQTSTAAEGTEHTNHFPTSHSASSSRQDVCTINSDGHPSPCMASLESIILELESIVPCEEVDGHLLVDTMHICAHYVVPPTLLSVPLYSRGIEKASYL